MLFRLLALAFAGSLVACGDDAVPPTAAASPTPVPTPTIALISASPAPGSAVSVTRNEPVTLYMRVTSPSPFSPSWLCVDYLAAGESSSGPCGQSGCPGNCVGQSAPIPPDTPQEFVISMGAATAAKACAYPRTTDRARVCFTNYLGQELRLPELSLSYTFVER